MGGGEEMERWKEGGVGEGRWGVDDGAWMFEVSGEVGVEEEGVWCGGRGNGGKSERVEGRWEEMGGDGRRWAEM